MVSPAGQVTHSCSQCDQKRQIKAGSRDRLPGGWKRHNDQVWCESCWRKAFILRSVVVPIVEPLTGSWSDLEADLREMWAATTNAANWMLTEMFARDVRRGEEEDKMPPMPKVYLYPDARKRFPSLPPKSVSALEQNVGKRYRAKRFDVAWRSASSLPTFRYPTPFSIPNQAWSVELKTEGRFVCSARIGEKRWEWRLKGGPRYRRQLAAVGKIASGEAVQGEMAIYRNGSGPEILCKMVAWLPRCEQKERSGILFVRTAPEALLVTFDDQGNRLWGLHFDHLRRWQAEHATQLKRWSYDQKMEQRRPEASFQKRREDSAVKYRNRMSSAVKEAAAQMAGYVDRLRFSEVRFNGSDKSFCESFPWFSLKERLACKLDEIGVSFVVESSMVPGEEEMSAIVKLNRKEKRERRCLNEAKEALMAAQQIIKNPEAQRLRIEESRRHVISKT